MQLLHDAPGGCRWITVRESDSIRYLELDHCEEGAMYLDSEEPVFLYLWFHRCSRLGRPVRRALVLGAGSFTASKNLAFDHPDADIDTVDSEPQLEEIARKFFRLEGASFARIAFHGQSAEEYLASSPQPCDFIFDDIFDGFQHVPLSSRARNHFRQLRQTLRPGGVCVKNVIWEPKSAGTRAACDETFAAMAAEFPYHAILALGPEQRGHNRLLLGLTEPPPVPWLQLPAHLHSLGVPTSFLDSMHVEVAV